MLVIPSLDIFSGKCVRLTEGDFSRSREYEETPLEVASKLKDLGAPGFHVVDLEGAKLGKLANGPAIRELLSLGLPTQVGGGIRNEADIQELLDAGADRVVIGSLGVKNPEQLFRLGVKFGFARFCIAMDLRAGRLATDGWQEEGGEFRPWLEGMLKRGFRRFLSTDIWRDGKLSGPNFALYESLSQEFPEAEWIASGGVSSLADLAALSRSGLYGVVVGKALFEGAIDPEALATAYWGSGK